MLINALTTNKLLWFLKSVWDFVWIFLYAIYNMNIFNIYIYIINKIRLYVVVFMKLRYNINLHNSFSEREIEITGDIMFNVLE